MWRSNSDQTISSKRLVHERLRNENENILWILQPYQIKGWNEQNQAGMLTIVKRDSTNEPMIDLHLLKLPIAQSIRLRINWLF